MAKRNWNKPRGELVETGVQMCRRGPLAGRIYETARRLARSHYIGADPTRAARHLARDIGAVFYGRHRGLTEEREEIAEMADTLHDEGWRPLFDTEERCFWKHEASGCSVNGRTEGGLFPSFEVATKAAYESPLRAALLKREKAS